MKDFDKNNGVSIDFWGWNIPFFIYQNDCKLLKYR